jgi:hypothetical protein
MKNQKRSICFRRARFFLALLAVIFLLQEWLRAQPAERPVENRFLFVFDTSSAMKKRLPAERTAVNRLFALAVNQQIQPGDSIGVWTFAADARAGEFPLQTWQPQNAETISSNILKFVKKQHYAKTTSFDKLMPLLDGVVSHSERLTMLIFCDGDGQMKGTPFDANLNAIFEKNRREMKKERQPFVIVLRSQFGQFTGYTANPGNGAIGFPPFPPMPKPPAPTNAPAKIPPRPIAPPLIIIGTTVTHRLPPPAPKPAPTNPPVELPRQTNAISTPTNSITPTNVAVPPTGSVAQTTAAAVPPENSIQSTNVAEPPPENPIQPTNVVVPPPENSGMSSGGLFAIGAGLLLAAGALIVLILRRSRETDSASLITRTMNDKK